MAVAIQALVRRRARGPLPGGLITIMPFAECPDCGALIQQLIDALRCPRCGSNPRDVWPKDFKRYL